MKEEQKNGKHHERASEFVSMRQAFCGSNGFKEQQALGSIAIIHHFSPPKKKNIYILCACVHVRARHAFCYLFRPL